LLGNAKSNKKPIAFVEDTAVPPENLADFIAEFKALLDGYNLDYGMFGHVDAGVLHVRPALDLTDPEQEKLLREISDKVVGLTAKYGGLMWGEHGKGYRSEYGPEFFGAELFNELRKIKAAFDPQNRLNPGKICTPLGSNEQLVKVDDVKRANYDKQIPIEVKTEFETTVNCNGNGLCFNYDTSSPMCPSYKHSKDRRYSPKGRASLMREWLRLQNHEQDEESRVTNGNGNVVVKTVNSVKKQLGDYDFSHEVKQSMDECLACKACTTACPIKVDVPTFRAKFIEQYHTRYLRPLSDYLVAHVEQLLPKLGQYPNVANFISHNPISTFVTRHIIGYFDAPKFSDNLKTKLGKEYWYSKKRFERLSDEQKAELRALKESAKEAMEPHKETMRSFKEAQQALIRSSAFTEDAFDSLVAQYKDDLVSAGVEKAKHRLAMFAVLTDEQQAQLKAKRLEERELREMFRPRR